MFNYSLYSNPNPLFLILGNMSYSDAKDWQNELQNTVMIQFQVETLKQARNKNTLHAFLL